MEDAQVILPIKIFHQAKAEKFSRVTPRDMVTPVSVQYQMRHELLKRTVNHKRTEQILLTA
jgi:hypothetical protein